MAYIKCMYNRYSVIQSVIDLAASDYLRRVPVILARDSIGGTGKGGQGRGLGMLSQGTILDTVKYSTVQYKKYITVQ